MKNIRQIFPLMIALSFFTVAMAGDKSGQPTATDTRTMKKADAIYNEIMMSLTPEMKARVDSSKTSAENDRHWTGTLDSAKQKKEMTKKNELDKKDYVESLPDDVQLRVEKALREMEARQKERTLEFKEIKRGKH